MFGLLGEIFTGLAIIVILIGLIKPQWVLFGIQNKTRGKVLLVYGLIFCVGMVFRSIGAPSNFEVGQKALTEKNYEYAIVNLKAVSSKDEHYTEAQALLKQATTELWSSKLQQANTALSSKNYNEIVNLLSDYPSNESGFSDANELLENAKAQLAEQEAQRQVEQEAKQLEKEQAKEAKRLEKEHAKAMSDYPACDSQEATEAIDNTMKNAPLGRVYGLSVVKIKNAHEVNVTPNERHCRGDAILNNASTYPISFSFSHDGDDVLVQAEVHGLE